MTLLPDLLRGSGWLRDSAHVTRLLKQDWARTRGDIRLNSGVPLSWLRGRSPVLSESRFAAKWQGSGVLYHVTAEGSVRVCLSP